MTSVFPTKPNMARAPNAPAKAISPDRRSGEGNVGTFRTRALPAASAAATLKHANGGGTSFVPTTESANWLLAANGKADPKPHAPCRPPRPMSVPLVSRFVSVLKTPHQRRVRIQLL